MNIISRQSRIFVTYWTAAFLVAMGASDLKFDRLGLNDGLSQSVVTCIMQDHLGYMWFGTQEGINKYDGHAFTTYRHHPFDASSLSDNFINWMLEDHKGQIWLITNGVLDRFDRWNEQFIHYQGSDADTPQNVNSIFETRGGALWLGSFGRGLFRYLPESDGFLRYATSEKAPLRIPDNGISNIYEDREGNLWVGTFGGGLLCKETGSESFIAYRHNPDDPTTIGSNNIPAVVTNITIGLSSNIHQDEQGMIWVGTAGSGLNRLDPETGVFQHFRHKPTDRHTLGSNTILSLFEDSRGWLWVTTSAGGLDLFNTETGQVIRYRHDPNDDNSLSHNQITRIMEDRDGMIWVGTAGGGLNRFDAGDRVFFNYTHSPFDSASISGNYISDLFTDRTGTIWIGTNGAGLSKHNATKQKFRHLALNTGQEGYLSDNLVWALEEDDHGQIWVGTRGAGIAILDAKGRRIVQQLLARPEDPHSVGGNMVRAIHKDDQNRIWVGSTGGGLQRYRMTSDDFESIDFQEPYGYDPARNNVNAIRSDAHNNLWVGTQAGLFRYDPDSDSSRRFANNPDDPRSLSNNLIFGLLVDRSDQLWVGTFSGLNRFEPSKGEFQVFLHNPDDPTSLSHSNIMAVQQLANGEIWVATFGGGINRYDQESSRFIHFTTRDGLANNMTYGILEDDSGHLWISTNNGISQFDPSTKQFRNYDVGDGLQSLEFNAGAYLKSRSGELFFGGINGINAFSPGHMKNNDTPPPVVITAIKQNGMETFGELTNLDKITLRHDASSFTIEFAALDYTNPAKNQYSYMLDGFDKAWIKSGNRRDASYTNLDGGRYTFRVRGSNNDGQWNLSGAQIPIEILPPVWKTTWFYGFEIILFLLAVLFIFQYQRQRLHSQKEEALMALEFERKTDELEYARKIQLSMLPERNHHCENIDIVGHMQTAHEVGGDYYDYYQLSPSRYCIIVGDATGHGVGAGLVVGMVKMASAVWAQNPESTPQELIRVINRALKTSIAENGMGMGLTLAMVDVDMGRVDLASAGMPFPFHYVHHERKIKPLVMKGPPLGFLHNIEVGTMSIQMSGGDYLVLLTDGYFERFDPDNQLWGPAQVESTLTGICRESDEPSEIVAAMKQACDRFARGRKNDDDMTIVVMAYHQDVVKEPMSKVSVPIHDAQS